MRPAPMAPRPRDKWRKPPPSTPTAAGQPAIGPYSTGDITVLEVGTQEESDNLAPFRRVATWFFWISLAISGILLFNLVFDVSKGSQTKLANSPDIGRITLYLSCLSYGLGASLVVLAVSYLFLTWGERSTGGIVLGTGLLCHWAVPFLIFWLCGRTAATAAVVQSFRMAGFIMVVLGGGCLAYDGYRWFRTLPDRMVTSASVGIPRHAIEQAHEAAFANVFSPCWQLSYCREVIRRQCPAFLAKSKCWKFGKGCFCDAEMFDRIIKGENLPQAKGTIQPTKRGKPPCGQCYIYLEHQSHKLRWISPLAIPLAVGLTGIMWPLYSMIWDRFGGVFSWLWKGVAYQSLASYGPPVKNAPTPVGQVSPEMVSLLARNMLGVMLGFFLMVSILRVVETAIDRWKW